MLMKAKTRIIAALSGILLLGGCHLAAIGAVSGALIGGAVADRPGAMIGGGAGMLVGAVADVLLYPMHQGASGSECDSYERPEEKRACEKRRAQVQEENRRERSYRAERYGDELQRERHY